LEGDQKGNIEDILDKGEANDPKSSTSDDNDENQAEDSIEGIKASTSEQLQWFGWRKLLGFLWRRGRACSA
jgi:hypothetical protein